MVKDTWITFDVLKLLCKADPDVGNVTTISLRKETRQLIDQNLLLSTPDVPFLFGAIV